MNRRHFLTKTMRAAGACVALPLFARNTVADESAAPTPCLAAAWKKHGMILDATEPWEGGSIQNFTCPAEPLEGDRWRVWYSSSSKIYTLAYADGVPGGSFKKVVARCSPGEPADEPFAIGNLPEKWNP
ncbi:MAG: hypothetical protein WA117_26400, partial [Verrucomicrobiia bacterium]